MDSDRYSRRNGSTKNGPFYARLSKLHGRLYLILLFKYKALSVSVVNSRGSWFATRSAALPLTP